ncbi:MAG: hypothetical protein EA350_03440 [Gemmatimonadales bacterium]|nr:MAG: hypothetical protein EA350_03440 [Gemmatimonadales bacterium]
MKTAAEPVHLDAPWGEIPLDTGRPVGRRIGPRELWVDMVQGEIRLADRKVAPGFDSPPDEPDAWSRWALPTIPQAGGGQAGPPFRLNLRPSLPDRAVIVQPEVPFSLVPRAEARIFVRIPLTIRVDLDLPGDAAPVLLRTLPTLELSDTWWGSFLDGELCYWLHTTARRAVGPELLEPHLVICPLHLVNQSRSDLKVEKLSFRVELLSLYADRTGFWADESRVRYQGDSEGSQIDMTGRPPEEAVAPRRIFAPPSAARGIRALTFKGFRGFSGIGGGT